MGFSYRILMASFLVCRLALAEAPKVLASCRTSGADSLSITIERHGGTLGFTRDGRRVSCPLQVSHYEDEPLAHDPEIEFVLTRRDCKPRDPSLEGDWLLKTLSLRIPLPADKKTGFVRWRLDRQPETCRVETLRRDELRLAADGWNAADSEPPPEK